VPEKAGRVGPHLPSFDKLAISSGGSLPAGSLRAAMGRLVEG
jgi:hypothetical protein